MTLRIRSLSFYWKSEFCRKSGLLKHILIVRSQDLSGKYRLVMPAERTRLSAP